MYLIDGAALAASQAGSHLMDIAYGPWLMVHDEREVNQEALPLSDIDSDGQADLWTSGCGTRTDTEGCRFYFYLSSQGAPAPYIVPNESGYALGLSDTFSPEGYVRITSSGDMDGDGFPELALYHGYDLDTDPQVAIRIIPGWDIPWDDPFYW